MPSAKRKRKPGMVPSSPIDISLPRQRMAYQIDDFAHQLTKEHPRVKQIHAGFKSKLEAMADKTMGGKTSMYKPGDKDDKMAIKDKPMGKAMTKKAKAKKKKVMPKEKMMK